MNTKIKRIFLFFLAFMMTASLVFTGTEKANAKEKTGDDVAALAKTFIGYPYTYGGAGPNSFDCSGFVKYVYSQFGVELPHNASEFYNNGSAYGTVVSEKDAQPGDIVSWTGGHAAIYIGDGQVVNALCPKYGVCTTNIATFRNKYGVTNPDHRYLRIDLSKTEEKAETKKSEKKAASSKKTKKKATSSKKATKTKATSKQTKFKNITVSKLNTLPVSFLNTTFELPHTEEKKQKKTKKVALPELSITDFDISGNLLFIYDKTPS